MSAFICHPIHVSAIVSFAARLPGSAIGDDAAAVARELFAANCASVAHRYPDPEGIADAAIELAGFVYSPDAGAHIKPEVIVKLCDCLDYQSCEPDDWDASPARAVIETIKQWAIALAPGYESSAAYKTAPWGIDPSYVSALAANAVAA